MSSSQITAITYEVNGDMRAIPHAGMVSLEDLASDELDRREAEQVFVDDDEPMTNDLPMIHTSTERLERLENSHKRLSEAAKELTDAFIAAEGGRTVYLTMATLPEAQELRELLEAMRGGE